MRIKRFCEARGLYESDNSIESKIFCFGDDGPSGDDSGDTSSTAASENIGTADVDVGPTTGGGGSDSNQQDRQAYSDRFGGVSTRNFNVNTNQGFVDTDQGRVYGSSDVLGKGIAEGDITPSESQQAALDTAGGIATDMGIDPSNIAVGGDLFFGEDDLMANQDLLGSMADSDVPEFDEPAGAVSMYGIPGVTPPGSYAATPVTQAARGPALGTTDYESDAYGTARTPSTTLGPAGASGIAAARDDFRARGLDTTAKTDPVTGQPVPGSGTGTRDVSTTISTTDMLDPFGEGFMTDDEIAKSNAELAAIDAQINAIRGASPVEQVTAQARGNTAPTGSVTISQPTTGYGLTTDVVTGTAVPGPTTTQPADITVTYGPEDLAREQANFEAARAEAYADKQFGFDTGLPESIDVFGVNVPTGIGIAERVGDALFDSEATLANAIAEIGIKSLDGASAEGTANYNPQGLEVVTSGGPLSEGGRTVAYDARGNIVYDSRGIGGQISDLLTFTRPPDNIQALYDKQNAIDAEQREREGGDGDDGGGQPIIPPPEEVIPPPEDYQGRDIVSGYQYQPRGPISYAYTGLPSLAPQVLRPSFQARGQYAPLFPMGNLRRS